MAKKKTGKQSPPIKEKTSPRATGATSIPHDSLDTLLRQRWHGAVNIRGIRFQIRYAALRALQLARAWRVESSVGPANPSEPMAKPSTEISVCIQFEGIEDLDVRDGAGPCLRPIWSRSDVNAKTLAPGVTPPTKGRDSLGSEFIQVKTADEPWPWHKLREPLAGFIPIVRAGDWPSTLRLVVNFQLQKHLQNLANFATLNDGAQQDLRTKFRALCQSAGATVPEADAILERLVIESLPESALRDRIQQFLIETFDLADTVALEAYDLVLVGKILDWSASRETVSGAHVFNVGRQLGEGIAIQSHYIAFARRWVGPVDFRVDRSTDDFFDGKRVRFGHVVASLDVKRPSWIGRIAQALDRAGTCIIRGPSGHGKSTLAFRFAFEYWSQPQTLIVRSAETTEQVTAIADYLRFRTGFGLPVRMLIEADYRTRMWPEVAAAAVAIGAQVLVTVRTEDWGRFRVDALTRAELIDPFLSLEEAVDIFHEFRVRQRVHPDVPSAAWAFEKLRDPPLVLEYVYLLTHGQMLEERLRDQVREFERLGEDPRKRELLRLAALGDALGAPVLLDRVLAAVPLRDDPQHVFATLVGEYIEIHDNVVVGLHWIRSEHLARILHEGGVPSVTDTALRVSALVSTESLRFLVAGALRWKGIDREVFAKGLVDKHHSASTETLLAILDGLFEAGERQFYELNRAIFDKAFDDMGPAGLLFLSGEVMPFLRTGTVDAMLDILDSERAEGFRTIKALSQRIPQGDRGLDLARAFLEAIAPHISVAKLRVVSATGRLLDWCALTGVSIPGLGEVLPGFVINANLLELPAPDTAWLAQGLYRYDSRTYDAWWATCRSDIVACAQLHLRALSVEFKAPSSVVTAELAAVYMTPGEESSVTATSQSDLKESRRARDDAKQNGIPSHDIIIVFPVQTDDMASPHEQKVWRLDLARQIFPFAGRYETYGDWFLPEEFPIPVDETKSRVSRWNCPYNSDVAKNVIWSQVASENYLPDSFYRLQEAWWNGRKMVLQLLDGINRMLVSALRGKRSQDRSLILDITMLLPQVQRRLKFLPRFDEASVRLLRQKQPLAERVSNAIKVHARATDNWRSHINNAIEQFVSYLASNKDDIGRLCVWNAERARDDTVNMQEFFEMFFAESPDYFAARGLNEEELRSVADFAVLLKARIVEQVEKPLDQPLVRLRERAASREAESIKRITKALGTVVGVETVAPRAIGRRQWMRGVVIGVEVKDPERPQGDLFTVADALRDVADEVDEFYFVPIQNGSRIGNGAFRIGSHVLRSDRESVDQADLLGMLIPAELSPPLSSLSPPLAVKNPEPSARGATGIHAWAKAYIQRRASIEAIGSGVAHAAYERLRDAFLRDLETTTRALIVSVATLRSAVVRDGAEQRRKGVKDDLVIENAERTLLAFADWASALFRGESTADELPWTVAEIEDAAERFRVT